MGKKDELNSKKMCVPPMIADKNMPFPELIKMFEKIEEYGKQCFIAGIEALIHHYKKARTTGSYPFVIDDKWNDYLKKNGQ